MDHNIYYRLKTRKESNQIIVDISVDFPPFKSVQLVQVRRAVRLNQGLTDVPKNIIRRTSAFSGISLLQYQLWKYVYESENKENKTTTS